MSDSEKARIWREAECIAAEDAYFEARPQIDGDDMRRVFDAGFERAWDQQQAKIDRIRTTLQSSKMSAAEAPTPSMRIIREGVCVGHRERGQSVEL
jgi:hypothetical protein